MVFRLVGTLSLLLGLLMLIPALISASYGESDVPAFLLSMCISVCIGLVLRYLARDGGHVGPKECFAVVTFGWVTAAALGALPSLFHGTFATFTDAFFEAMSGLTTTGASVLTNIEAQPHGILFWRSFLHWLGGMGIIVLFIAVLPSLGIGATKLFRAEVPGPTPERLEPRIRDTAKKLWAIYVGISLLQTVLLHIGGMTLFDALTHTFGTVATGGFSTRTASVGAYNSVFIEIVMIVFMFIAGCNFALHFRMLQGKRDSLFKDAEFKTYLLLIAAATLVVTLNLRAHVFPEMSSALRGAAFQVTSIMTTTGFATADFDAWPSLSKTILLVLMFVGGCTGSTGGAIKVSRIMIAFKHGYREALSFIHPRAVTVTKVNGSVVSPNVLNSVLGFLFLYSLIFVIGTLFMSSLGLDIISAGSSVAATLGNIGPGLGLVGPTLSYATIPISGKWVLSLCMLLGRLEIFSVLVLFLPEFWRRH